MKTILALSAFVIITTLVATINAQKQWTDEYGRVHTTEESDKYGAGGTKETIADNFKIVTEIYKDKNGTIRERRTFVEGGNTWTSYYDEKGKSVVQVFHSAKGDKYYEPGPNPKPMDLKEGKALVEKLEKTPSPTTATGGGAPGAPEKPKPEVKRKPEGPTLLPFEQAPPLNWTGAYLGVVTSYTRLSTDVSLTPTGLWDDFPTVSDEIRFRGRHEFDEDGAGVGGVLGYNYEFPSHAVIGFEVEGRGLLDLCDHFDTRDFRVGQFGFFDVISKENLSWLFTFSPRFGYAFGRFLPYVSGGFAIGDFHASQIIKTSNFPCTSTTCGNDPHGAAEKSSTEVGWTVGTGVEYALANNWRFRVGYEYADLGTVTFGGHLDTFHAFTTRNSASMTAHSGTFGIIYNFH